MIKHRPSALRIVSEIGESIAETRALGQYPTRAWFAERIIEHYFPRLDQQSLVIDAGCGPGAFLSAIPAEVPAFGIDIDARMCDQARANTGRPVLHGDFRNLPINMTPTLIVGNPPFNAKTVDGFLDRSYELLPEGGVVGFVLPAYLFQTANTVARYAERWSLRQDLIPRNVFQNLSLPILFAIFTKDRRRSLVGFAFYQEVADVQKLPQPYRDALNATSGAIWLQIVDLALLRLGGEAGLPAIYDEIEGPAAVRTRFWREKVRQTLRRYSDRFRCTRRGRYARYVDSSNHLAAA